MLNNDGRVLTGEVSRLKNEFVILKSKETGLKHEISILKDNLQKSHNNQDLKGSQLVKDLSLGGCQMSLR